MGMSLGGTLGGTARVCPWGEPHEYVLGGNCIGMSLVGTT